MSVRKREKWYWFLGFQYRFPRRRVWVSLLMSAPITFVGAFLTIRDAVLPRVYGEVRIAEFLPSFYWYWHWYVILALAYLIVLMLFLAPVANRATLERQRERNEEKLRRYKGLLERSYTAGAPQELSLDALRKTYELVALQPNLVHPLEGAVEDVHEEEYGVIARGHIENGKNFRAVIATYKNSPDTRSKRRIVGIEGVAAEVSYVSFGGTSPERAHHGAWLSEKDRKINFDVPGRHDLIAATVENDQLYAVERETTGVHPNGVTNRTKLTGDLFKLRVRLIDAFGAILDDYEMMLTVNREPGLKVELFSARYWTVFRLRDLFKEGHDLLMRAYEITINTQEQSLAIFKAGNTPDWTTLKEQEKQEEVPLAAEVKEWETRVGEFLGLHVSEEQKESFMTAKPSINDGLNRVQKHAFERLRPSGSSSDEKSYWTLTDSIKARYEKLDKIRSSY